MKLSRLACIMMCSKQNLFFLLQHKGNKHLKLNNNFISTNKAWFSPSSACVGNIVAVLDPLPWYELYLSGADGVTPEGCAAHVGY